MKPRDAGPACLGAAQLIMHHPTGRRSYVIIADVEDHPRQIYTSVRAPRGLSGRIATRARAISVVGLAILVLGSLAVAIVSLV